MILPSTPKIAIIGSGIAGLSAAHFLEKQFDVSLFEKNDRLGGHTNTVNVLENNNEIAIDTGFIVMNNKNYPNFANLLEELDIPLFDSNMSFGYHDHDSNLQYSGSGINGIFAQRKNIFNLNFHILIKEIFRFYKQAKIDLSENCINIDESLNDYLKRYNFNYRFIDHHLIPMGSAIWSTPYKDMLNFPAQNFLNFFNNHGLLSLKERPKWKTITGGSSTYIKKMIASWKNVKIITNVKIENIKRCNHKINIYTKKEMKTFDHVILAVHADQVLKLLGDANIEEENTFNSWEYSKSKTFLHTDSRVMPSEKKVWSSWNFSRITNNKTFLTYYMNMLQPLKTSIDYFVSLNPPYRPNNILYEIDYSHPIFSKQSIDSRLMLKEINGNKNTWFTGSYVNNGFHEDAVSSSMEVSSKIKRLYEV